MDNGYEVIAKLPNPNAGPPHYTTASEVATVNFLRSILQLPAPHILGWSSTSGNPVGAEYIIMEKAKGTVLSELWYQLPRSAKNEVIQQVVDLEVKLSATSFPAHGCLFYQTDIPERLSYELGTPGDKYQQFRLGPIVHPGLWEDGRQELEVCRGPWTALAEYSADLGRNEREWVKSFGRPRMNYYRDDHQPELPCDMLDLIDKFLSITPYITESSKTKRNICTPTLWHSDLNLNNIFIDPASNFITSVIDWQSTQAAPLILQAKIPRMVEHIHALEPGWILPEKPSNYENLDPKEKLKTDKLHESALCQKYYEVLTAKRNPLHYSALRHNDTMDTPLCRPLRAVCGAWKNRQVFKLRSNLVSIRENWQQIGTALEKCPIHFTEEELKLHEEELGNIDYIEQMMEGFQEAGILPADGRVDPEDFDYLQNMNHLQREQYLSMAGDETERKAMEKIWPYQDWPDL